MSGPRSKARSGAGARALLQRLTQVRGEYVFFWGGTAVMRVPDVVLAAEELRSAVRSLGRIVGRVDVEDLLDVIFRDFCIGK